MRKNFLTRMALLAFIVTSCLLIAQQEECELNENENRIAPDEENDDSDDSDDSASVHEDSNSYSSPSEADPSFYESSPDYISNSSHYEFNDFGNYRQHSQRYGESGNFSSGVSSYQGTSTGPGPNGGYPGAPRGTYQTYYIPR